MGPGGEHRRDSTETGGMILLSRPWHGCVATTDADATIATIARHIAPPGEGLPES